MCVCVSRSRKNLRAAEAAAEAAAAAARGGGASVGVVAPGQEVPQGHMSLSRGTTHREIIDYTDYGNLPLGADAATHTHTHS